jgi:hypothetical protein
MNGIWDAFYTARDGRSASRCRCFDETKSLRIRGDDYVLCSFRHLWLRSVAAHRGYLTRHPKVPLPMGISIYLIKHLLSTIPPFHDTASARQNFVGICLTVVDRRIGLS